MTDSGAQVLIAGETWITFGQHLKGFATYTTGGYATGLAELEAALKDEWRVTSIPNHLAPTEFPDSIDQLRDYAVVILSDIPADTLLLHPDTFERGKATPNRLSLLSQYVSDGGGLLMIGGYMSFSGFDGKARYQNTPLAEVLPVEMLGHDDRIETPEGVTPIPTLPGDHPVLAGIPSVWPPFFGYNRLRPKPNATVLLELGNDAFLTVGTQGRGRTAAFASDCSPHWGSPEFTSWPSYGPFWNQLLAWLGEGST